MLTNEQIQFCNTFGFVVQRQLFNAAEIHTIGAEAAAAIEELYSDRQGGTHGRWTPLQKPSTPFNASLLQDARFSDPRAAGRFSVAIPASACPQVRTEPTSAPGG